MLRLLSILLPLLLCGCGTLWDAGLSLRCGRSDECAERGECGVRTWRAGDRGWRCVVESADDCADASVCREEGRCGFDPHIDEEACIAAEPAHCLESAECAAEGRCALGAAGACVTSEQGCRDSAACAEDDRCAPRDEGFCSRAWADAVTWCDEACRSEGACERDGEACRVVKADDCRASDGCRDHGRCVLDPVAGVCIAGSDADCAASTACVEGLGDGTRPCTLRGARCADARSACERSPHCLTRGDCVPMEGTCAPSDDSCPGSVECLVEGRCVHINHLCLPMDESHCEASLHCAAFDRCQFGSWLVHQCSDGSGIYPSFYGCAVDPCLDEGRCLQDGAGVCHTPAELGLDDPLPRRPRAPAPVALEPLPAVDGRGMKALLDGQAVTFTHALWARRGGQTQQVLLTSGAVDCSQVAGVPPLPEELNFVQLALAPRLGAGDGSLVSRAAWGLAGQGVSAYGEGDMGAGRIAGGRVTLRVSDRLRNSSIELEGSMPVHSCGELEPVTQPRPSEGLSVTLHGEHVPVAMAVVDELFDTPTLVLPTQPVTCSWRHWQRGEPDLMVLVNAEGRVEIEGARVPGSVDIWTRAATLELGETDHNDELEVTVGLDDPNANPPLWIEGTVRAVECRL